MKLVVSIHDVSPLTRAATEQMLGDLGRLGLERTSLLVVPNHHHRGHFLEDASFCDWLRACADAGHEIVVHGYFHQRERKGAESLLAKWITRVYTAGEGEFFDIDHATAAAAVIRAREEFQKLGLNPVGFIAPAWLLSPEAERALAEAGFDYTTRLGSVLDLKTGNAHLSQSMVYSVRNAWRRGVSRLWNASLYRRLRGNPLLRIGIHPPDLRHPEIWTQIRKFTALALAERQPGTYESWLRDFRQLHSSGHGES